jgi:hypothetical protein
MVAETFPAGFKEQPLSTLNNSFSKLNFQRAENLLQTTSKHILADKFL